MSMRWNDIPTYEGLYEVSDSGVVRSFIRSGSAGKDLKQHEVKGYLQVWLSKNNKVRKLSVHRAVLMAFHRLPNDGEVCNHKNGNKLDNHLENLEWCTREQNEKHKREVLGKDDKGEKNGNFGYRKALFFPTEATRNRLAALGIPRNKHDIVSLGATLPPSLVLDLTYFLKISTNGDLWYVAYETLTTGICFWEKSNQREAEARGLMLAYLIANKLVSL